ncbi:iron-containing alcohol dehydrogenase family protein [Streptomyces formicae]|uniref:Iron-containing alcohol dehydrogenase n=1 Tax=Streptomyces formicae TaxID=1616117 RepID=A0ABY3WI53_9ACTN|nr:iron-containing alcohol dehydrogenase [Streptomyces formicae]UNM12258.1 iron-containing alcohol dehydrogenase [Streptomyces formicae]
MNRTDRPPASLTHSPTGCIEFGNGAIDQLPAAIHRTRAEHAFIVTDPGVRSAGILARVTDVLDRAGIGHDVYAEVPANPSTTAVVAAAVQARYLTNAAVVALGGGSAMDAAKCVALLATNGVHPRALEADIAPEHDGLPVIAVPTTAGTGAETNSFAVIEAPDPPRKVYIGHTSVQPRVCVLDPELTLTLSAAVTAATGMDALVHCVESLASRSATPFSQRHALHAVSLILRWLPAAVENGHNLRARSNMLIGAHLAGLALSSSGLGLIHGIAHAVTPRVGAPHGQALSSVLPAVMDWCAPHADTAYRRLAHAMGLRSTTSQAAIDACRELADLVGARHPLSSYGVTSTMVADLAWTAMNDPVSANSPRTPTIAETASLISACL